MNARNASKTLNRVRCGLLLLWASAGFATLAPALPAAATRTVVFFGDSLTAGFGLENPSAESYPALIEQKISGAQLSWRVVNAGLSGETTAGGLRRVDWILRQPIDIFVLALGANDGLRGVNPSDSRNNLQKIIDRVRAKNPEVKMIVAGLEMPPSMGTDFTQAFSAIFPAVAQKNAATLLPSLLEGVGGSAVLNQADRIHPNPAGHRVIAESVWRVLRPLL